ncbi:MAG: hypothetical protein JO356_13375 [Acidobacteria bacterium]|nr:hypothetical protein [Acidobacteriota bacterium]
MSMVKGYDNASAQLRASKISEYSTKPLSLKTWPDFERLFRSHPAPGAYPCWCMYNHSAGAIGDTKGLSRVARIEQNRREKKRLVEKRQSHGILVFAQGEPVGWCQYGQTTELPRIDTNREYRALSPRVGKALWRITCFVVHKKYRRRAVARTALKAALVAIEKQGGGLVEAYPIKRWEAYTKYRGTASMFKKEGFRIVARLGDNNLLMQKEI